MLMGLLAMVLVLCAAAVAATPGEAHAAQKPAYAMLYSDGTLVFQRGDKVLKGHGRLIAKEKNIEAKNCDVKEMHGPWKFNVKKVKKVVFANKISPRHLQGWFYDMTNLKSISHIERLDTSKTTDLTGLFAYCSSLKSLDLSKFKTGHIEAMSLMFIDCKSLKSLDLSSFDMRSIIVQTLGENTTYSYANDMLAGCTALRTLVLPSKGILRDDCGLKKAPQLAKVSGVSAKGSKKGLTMAWKGQSTAKGYQVRYATSKTMKGAIVKNVAAKSSLKVSKLKSKKTYYVQVRASEKIGKTTCYSPWSKAVKVKTK